MSCKIYVPCSENCSRVGSSYQQYRQCTFDTTLWNVLMTIVGPEMQEWFAFIVLSS